LYYDCQPGTDEDGDVSSEAGESPREVSVDELLQGSCDATLEDGVEDFDNNDQAGTQEEQGQDQHDGADQFIAPDTRDVHEHVHTWRKKFKCQILMATKILNFDYIKCLQ
jgi:hypothetical protein